MTDFDSAISRAESDDPLVPTPVSAQIIQEMVKASAVMSLARRVPMSSKTSRQPVLSALPQAYFVDGDTGLKKATKQEWENLTLVAEELAVIVPIPEAYLDDAQVPIWDEVRPRIVEAIGAKVDAVTIFGGGELPSTWGTAIIDGANTASNTVAEGSGSSITGSATDDLGVDVAALGILLAEEGFAANGFATGPGFRWKLVGMRSQDGIPIYAPPAGDQPGTLYGYPVQEQSNGGWDSSQASLIAGDWSKAILGVRQDITFKVFTEGVISDDSGNVILNLMQQDSVALRAVIRLAWQVANPVTTLEATEANRFPFAVLTPAGS